MYNEGLKTIESEKKLLSFPPKPKHFIQVFHSVVIADRVVSMAPKKTFVVHGFKCTATMDRANSLLLTVSVGASSKDWPRKRLNKDVDLEAAAAQLIRAATSPQPESHQSQPDAPCSESVEGPIDGSAGRYRCVCACQSPCRLTLASRLTGHAVEHPRRIAPRCWRAIREP